MRNILSVVFNVELANIYKSVDKTKISKVKAEMTTKKEEQERERLKKQQVWYKYRLRKQQRKAKGES